MLSVFIVRDQVMTTYKCEKVALQLHALLTLVQDGDAALPSGQDSLVHIG
jgi:hypothetical protein